MAKRKEFTRIDHDNSARIDVLMDVDAGKIVHWCINLTFIDRNGVARDVYRADTCHGFMHEQRFWQSRRKIMLEGNYDVMFHAKSKEVKENYARWIMLFRKRRGI